ncbi:MAG: class I SAM-dependent methyltransferase [Candidatus Hodarchaeota archaeon]
MGNRKKFDWRIYVKQLPDYPLLSQKWERDFVHIICDNIEEGGISRVLEVGCSNGRWLRWFNREFGCKVWGLDKEELALEVQDGVIKFTIGNALHIPYKDGVFDTVFSLGLVEHFSEKDKYQILKEQQRVLREGGYLICQVPLLSFFSLDYVYVKFFYDLRRGTKHFKTTKRELKDYFRKLGLRIIFSGFSGSLLEMNIVKKLSKLNFFNRLFASEILIIGKKIGRY